jgi:hypothetical protein
MLLKDRGKINPDHIVVTLLEGAVFNVINFKRYEAVGYVCALLIG